MISDLAFRLAQWHLTHGRHDLPWQHQGPYATWVSEVMLQQTQVATVIPYYQRFMDRFPTPAALSDAPMDEVLSHWAGLGYYARARNLHHAAKQVQHEFAGELPDTLDALMSLKGIGRSTAGAILSLGFKKYGVIQDGNVRRVLARLFAISGDLTSANAQKRLWALATDLTPKEGKDAAIHTQAMMDLGALVCTKSKPTCDRCPLVSDCSAYKQDLVHRLPEPKTRKVKQTREWVVLQLVNTANETFVVKRPPKGIWGGLYAPPISESRSALAKELGLELADVEEVCELRHAFSHFSVNLQLHRIMGLSSVPRVPGKWVDLRTFEGGLPAPIYRLLQENMT